MNVAEQKIVRVYPDSKSEEKEILLLKEHTFLIKVNGAAWASLVCTDTNLMELVAGHLLSSGLIEKKEDIARIDFCETKRKADVFLNREISWTQKEKSEASCCPKNERFLEAATVPLNKIAAAPCEPEWIFKLANAFSNESAIHKWTAGTHSCILAKKGQPLFVAEDIGRHTALDKALGWMLLNDVPRDEAMLYTSGRVPVDMAEKVIRAGVGVLLSKSVPTAESVALCNEWGLRLYFRAWPDSYDTV